MNKTLTIEELESLEKWRHETRETKVYKVTLDEVTPKDFTVTLYFNTVLKVNRFYIEIGSAVIFTSPIEKSQLEVQDCAVPPFQLKLDRMTESEKALLNSVTVMNQLDNHSHSEARKMANYFIQQLKEKESDYDKTKKETR